MLYCVGIGLAFVIVGHALERGLHLAGRATRWAWVIAIVGSYLVPVAAWLRPETFATFAAPIPVVFESGPSLGTSTTSTIGLFSRRSRPAAPLGMGPRFSHNAVRSGGGRRASPIAAPALASGRSRWPSRTRLQEHRTGGRWGVGATCGVARVGAPAAGMRARADVGP